MASRCRIIPDSQQTVSKDHADIGMHLKMKCFTKRMNNTAMIIGGPREDLNVSRRREQLAPMLGNSILWQTKLGAECLHQILSCLTSQALHDCIPPRGLIFIRFCIGWQLMVKSEVKHMLLMMKQWQKLTTMGRHPRHRHRQNARWCFPA